MRQLIIAICLLITSATVSAQSKSRWTVTELHPNLSPLHNSVTVTHGDSAFIIQFKFESGKFPAVKDTVSVKNNRNTMLFKGQAFEVIRIYPLSKP